MPTIVTVLADVTASANGYFNPGTFLQGLAATDATSLSGIPTQSSVGGQAITISQPAPTATIAIAPGSPSGTIVMGSTGNTLLVLSITNTGLESFRVTDLTIADKTASNPGNFTNLTLWSGTIPLGTAVAIPTTGTGAMYSFHISTSLIVTLNPIPLTLKGDVAPYALGIPDNAVHSFGVDSAQGIGITSQRAVELHRLDGYGGNFTVLRTDLAVSATASGGSQHIQSSFDEVGRIVLAANVAGGLMVNSLTLTFTGSAAPAILTSLDNVTLTEYATGVNLDKVSGGSTGMNPATGTYTWFFPANSAGVAAGNSTCPLGQQRGGERAAYRDR